MKMNTPDQMIQRYRNELKTYKEFIDTLHPLERQDPMSYMDNATYDKVRIWTGKMTGMEEILGLTEEEITQYGEEAGINMKTKTDEPTG